MKIVIYELNAGSVKSSEILVRVDHNLIFVDRPLTTDTTVQHIEAEVISTFIYSELGAETLKDFPLINLFATRSTGFNHIDIDY